MSRSAFVIFLFIWCKFEQSIDIYFPGLLWQIMLKILSVFVIIKHFIIPNFWFNF